MCRNRNGTWTVRTWTKGQWTADPSKQVSNHRSDATEESDAKKFLKEFIGDSIFVDYNGVDATRVQTWGVELQNAKHFDFYHGACRDVFGYKDHHIVQTPDCKLETITNDLFVLGCTGWQPAGPAPSAPLALGMPHLDEVTMQLKRSDEPLDCQRLMNIYVAIRNAYQLE